MKYLNKLILSSLLFTCLSLIGVNAQTTAAAANNATKKVRVGMAAVKTTSVGEGMDAQQFAAGVQNTLSEYLKGTSVELVAIEARLPAAIEAEAREKALDYLVYVSAAHKKGGGGFGKMFGAVAPVLGQVASTAIMTAATMSQNVKAKDSLQLDLIIQKSGEPKTPAFAKSYKAKAKSDGEDIFTPLIEQMAQAVIDTTSGQTANPALGKK